MVNTNLIGYEILKCNQIAGILTKIYGTMECSDFGGNAQ
jgi:hypothetical protein